MAVAWADVRAVLLGIAQGRCPADAAAVAQQWREFAALYREHITLEERDVFPLAREHTGADGLRAMADEMARRRGAH
jgi:hemerythrin-like domain-containing protein